jgi:hypothetical protein
MRGVVVATTSPHAVYADARGAFSFSNLPPGAYTIRVVSDGRTSERTVDIKGAHMDLGDVRPGGGA